MSSFNNNNATILPAFADTGNSSLFFTSPASSSGMTSMFLPSSSSSTFQMRNEKSPVEKRCDGLEYRMDVLEHTLVDIKGDIELIKAFVRQSNEMRDRIQLLEDMLDAKASFISKVQQ